MWITTPAKEVFEKMSRIVCEEIDTRKFCGEPSRKKIDRERKTVHLGEQGDDECREGTERPPVPRGFWLGKAE